MKFSTDEKPAPTWKVPVRFLGDLDVDVDAVGRGAFLGGDVDALEVTERGDELFGGLELGLAEEAAFGDLHFAADDLVAGLGVAADLDAIEVDGRSAPDGDDDVHLLLVGVELGLRVGLDVGVAFVAVHRAHRLQIFGELGAIEDIAGLGAYHLAQMSASLNRLDLAAGCVPLVDFQLADLVARAFVDGERDLDAASIRRQHHARRRHADRQKPTVVIGGVDHQDVAFERVLTKGPARAERKDAPLAGVHDVAQLLLGHVVVADERDPANRHRLVLDDFEEDVDFVVLAGRDVERRLGQEISLLGVQIADLLHAAPERGVAQDGVRLGLDALLQLLGLDLVVALELDLLDVRPLAHDEAQRDAVVPAIDFHLHVVEESGVPELAHVARESLGGERLPHVLAQVGEEVLLRNAPVADDFDLCDRIGCARARLRSVGASEGGQ